MLKCGNNVVVFVVVAVVVVVVVVWFFLRGRGNPLPHIRHGINEIFLFRFFVALGRLRTPIGTPFSESSDPNGTDCPVTYLIALSDTWQF